MGTKVQIAEKKRSKTITRTQHSKEARSSTVIAIIVENMVTMKKIASRRREKKKELTSQMTKKIWS
jgi:hypothetical protein